MVTSVMVDTEVAVDGVVSAADLLVARCVVDPVAVDVVAAGAVDARINDRSCFMPKFF